MTDFDTAIINIDESGYDNALFTANTEVDKTIKRLKDWETAYKDTLGRTSDRFNQLSKMSSCGKQFAKTGDLDTFRQNK